jgi:multicomponent Na+:H+ antiporter subunit E
MTAMLLAAAWVALTGDLTWPNALVGVALGVLLVRVVPPRRPLRLAGLRRLPQVAALLVWFLGQLGLANLRVVALVLRPRPGLRPGILAVPVDLPEDWQVALLANLITLTPGTLTVDVTGDGRTLFVHFLHLEDPERERRALREGFERRVRRLAA